MKNILFSIVLLFTLNSTLIAQAPQGLNYQAVAYDGSGIPVANQGISVRLSILDGLATGPVVYEETQNPSTDNTGLFSIVIGNGTIISGTFAAINWGNGTKWLKTEIDITGGVNYLVVGTSQFLSVPYALYANQAGFTSGSFTNPDGFEHAMRVIIKDSTDYTVPAGKNLYIPTAMNGVRINGSTFFTNVSGTGADAKTFLGAGENSVVWFRYDTKVCFLVDKRVDWKTIDLAGPAFTVPAGKQFVVIAASSFYDNYPSPMPTGCQYSLNGILYSVGEPFLTNSILDAGDVLTTTGCTDPGFRICINGYFKDR